MEKKELSRLLCDFISEKQISETLLEKLSAEDWDGLLKLAIRFKVSGLFNREIRIRNYPASLIPERIRTKLREEYRNIAVLNTGLFFDAEAILKSFEDNLLKVIALKGFSIAKKNYGDIGLRPMSDIDLLVKEKDLVKAGKILLGMGYKQDFPDWDKLLKTHHHLPPFTNNRGTIIELHWNIIPPDNKIKPDIEGLWERADLIKLNNFNVFCLSEEDLFLHLCIHACVHLQTGIDLIPFCDIAALIKKSGDKIDWKIIRERSFGWGGQKCVYLILLMVSEILGVKLSEKIMSGLKPIDYKNVFFEEALEQLFEINPTSQQTVNRIGEFFQIIKIEGLKAKINLLLKKAFPSKEILSRFYPVSVSSRKIYLCYLFRLKRLVIYYSKILFHLILRDKSVMKALYQSNRGEAVSAWMFS